MSNKAGKGRLNCCDLKLIWFENWYHEKMKQKKWKIEKQLNLKIELKGIEDYTLISWVSDM